MVGSYDYFLVEVCILYCYNYSGGVFQQCLTHVVPPKMLGETLQPDWASGKDTSSLAESSRKLKSAGGSWANLGASGNNTVLT